MSKRQFRTNYNLLKIKQYKLFTQIQVERVSSLIQRNVQNLATINQKYTRVIPCQINMTHAQLSSKLYNSLCMILLQNNPAQTELFSKYVKWACALITSMKKREKHLEK